LAVLVVWGAATVAFAAMHLLPGDPVRAILGGSATSPEAIRQARRELGFDRPIMVQYGRFLGDLLHGDLGRSYQLQQPVSQIVWGQAWPSIELALSGFLLALAGAFVLALATAHRRRALRRVSSALELIATSSPAFWIGSLLLVIFSFRLHVFPAASGTDLRGLVLPAVTLAVTLFGVMAQVLREALEQAIEEPFVLTARARGTSERRVRTRHALRHALVPFVTLSGWTFGALLSGSVVIETIFSRPGVGRVLATAVASRDFPVVVAIVIASAALFTVINLVVDLLYRVIDPRIREAGT
jgi:peptide/nickel transport system permease protein